MVASSRVPMNRSRDHADGVPPGGESEIDEDEDEHAHVGEGGEGEEEPEAEDGELDDSARTRRTTRTRSGRAVRRESFRTWTCGASFRNWRPSEQVARF